MNLNGTTFIGDTRKLLKPILEDPIKAARGFLKGSCFTSERYMQLKQEEKELEK
ncbi:MAG: hypothetical protein QG641_2827 [Candidatus Poribacteria bacterium]|nr:hypothetical protein [Candidatus Poribacteria bacterium]